MVYITITTEEKHMENKMRMSDKEFDDWFSKSINDYADSHIKEIENSEEYKNSKGISPEAMKKLMKKAEEIENGNR